MTAPLELRAGGSSATIHPDLGGRLGRLDLGDGPLLRGRDDGAGDPLGWANWGCYPLLPWSNRIPGGRLRFGPIDATLPVNWEDGSAIHGLTADAPWTVVERAEASAVLEVEASAGPYHVRGILAYRLDPEVLSVDLTATNLAGAPVPAGLGLHPWFRAGVVRVPAALRWPGEPLPTGPPVPVDPGEDLRAGRVPPPMDRCFTGLTEPAVAVPGVEVAWDGPVTQVVVYAAEPGWVAVEPVTMANDGIGLAERGIDGHGVKVLGPGDDLSVTYRFRRRPT